MSKNINIYKRLKNVEQARIIYNSFQGIAHRLENGKLKPIVIIQIPDIYSYISRFDFLIISLFFRLSIYWTLIYLLIVAYYKI